MPKAYGFLHVFDPEREIPVAADIVFVHGLFGDQKETWTKHLPTKARDSAGTKNARLANFKHLFSRPKSPATEKATSSAPTNTSTGLKDTTAAWKDVVCASEIFWPQDLLPIELPNCRILSWGYDANIDHLTSSASTATVYNHASNLLSALTDIRMTDELRKRPIIFIAHSLGGIVVKDALNESLVSLTHLKEVAPATFGICFLGTPHRGTSIADFGETILRISKLWFKSPNLQVLQALKYDAETLDRVQTRFKQTLQSSQCRIRVRSFIEARKTHDVQIVNRFSATVEDVREIVSDIDSDHRHMTKFEGLKDPGFLSIVRTLHRWIADMKDPDKESYERFVKAVREGFMKRFRNDERQSRLSQITGAFAGTFSWIFSEELQFTAWLSDSLEDESSIFWIQGKPGSGKSTLMKYIFENDKTLKLLKSNMDGEWIKISFFAYDRGSSVQKSIEGLLQEMIYQLCAKLAGALEIITDRLLQQNSSMSFIQSARSLTEDSPRGEADSAEAITDPERLVREVSLVQQWTLDNMTSAILAIFNDQSSSTNLAFFIDGLDEFNDNHRHLVEVLRGFTADKSVQRRKIKLCLSSRPEPLFKFAFGYCPGFSIHDYTRSDIQLYAYRRIASAFPYLDREPDTLSELQELIFEMTDKANGVFIWVRLVVDELVDRFSDGCSITELRKVLSHIPAELEDLYRRIIARQKKDYAHEAYVMIQILLRMRRPLDISAINGITDVAILNKIESISAQSMRRRLASRCGGLIETITGSDDLRFLHQTAKTFFEDDRNIQSMFATRIKGSLEDGLTYLLRFSVHLASLAPSSSLSAYSSFLDELFVYAGLVETVLGMRTIDFLDPLLQPRAAISASGDDTPSLAASKDSVKDGLAVWESIRLEHHPEDIRSNVILSSRMSRPSKLLAYAASFGLFQYVKSKLDSGAQYLCHDCWPLLHCAIIPIVQWDLEKEMVPILLGQIQFLLKQGGDPNEIVDGKSALGRLLSRQPGSSLGRSTTVGQCIKILLDGGADPNLKYRTREVLRSPLSHAVEFSWASDSLVDETLQILLDHGADCNSRDGDGFTPLFFAIERGNQRAAQLLLEHGANPTNIGAGINALRPETCRGRPLISLAISDMQDLLQARTQNEHHS